jgi:hypothetical protein
VFQLTSPFGTANENLAFNLETNGKPETKILRQNNQSGSKNTGFPFPEDRRFWELYNAKTALSLSFASEQK